VGGLDATYDLLPAAANSMDSTRFNGFSGTSIKTPMAAIDLVAMQL